MKIQDKSYQNLISILLIISIVIGISSIFTEFYRYSILIDSKFTLINRQNILYISSGWTNSSALTSIREFPAMDQYFNIINFVIIISLIIIIILVMSALNNVKFLKNPKFLKRIIILAPLAYTILFTFLIFELGSYSLYFPYLSYEKISYTNEIYIREEFSASTGTYLMFTSIFLQILFASLHPSEVQNDLEYKINRPKIRNDNGKQNSQQIYKDNDNEILDDYLIQCQEAEIK